MIIQIYIQAMPPVAHCSLRKLRYESAEFQVPCYVILPALPYTTQETLRSRKAKIEYSFKPQ
jgi:hypothetical protein